MYNLAFIIAMYNEHTTVFETVSEIITKDKNATILVEHSDDENDDGLLEYIRNHTIYTKHENLGEVYPFRLLHAQANARNFSSGFSKLYSLDYDFDYIICMLGDTLIYNLDSFYKRFSEMEKSGYIAYVSQAIGEYFIEAEFNMNTEINGIPPKGKRFQHELITDFMPQLFILDGKFAKKNRLYANIEITNPFTSEQCLGDELLKSVGSVEKFHKMVGKLAKRPFDYKDGVILQNKE